MKRQNTYNNDVIEFTILEDYTKEVSTGKKEMEVEGQIQKVSTFKEVTTRGVKSKMTVYASDVRRVRSINNSRLKVYKDRCLIKVENDFFVVKGNYNDTLSLIYKNFKNNKIGF